MRYKLKPYVGKKMRFQATLFKFGKRWTSDTTFYKTAMIKDVRERWTGELLADHVWFNETGWTKGIALGQTITFKSTVVPYEHGWDENGKETFDFDYALTIPKGVFVY